MRAMHLISAATASTFIHKQWFTATLRAKLENEHRCKQCKENGADAYAHQYTIIS